MTLCAEAVFDFVSSGEEHDDVRLPLADRVGRGHDRGL